MNKEEKQIDLIECRRKYQGVGFIKSRKSKFANMNMAEDMVKMACANGVEIENLERESDAMKGINEVLVSQLEIGGGDRCYRKGMYSQ